VTAPPHLRRRPESPKRLRLVPFLAAALCVASGAQAGSNPRPERSLGNVEPLSARILREQAGRRAGERLSSGDTVWVFRDSLESYTSPSGEGLWTHTDASAQVSAWHIDTTYTCAGHAFWCGRIDSTWTNDPNRFGYDNSWDQSVENFVDLSGAVSPVNLSFRHALNVEPNYDFGLVEIFDPDEDWLPIALFTGTVHGPGNVPCDTFTVVIPDSIRAKYNPIRFRFRFQSDIQVSSADGFYPGDGWCIDNVTVKAGLTDVRFFDDFESGIGTWAVGVFPPVGEFWRIRAGVPTQEQCTADPSKVWDPTVPGSGGLLGRMDARLASPPVAVNRSDQVFVAFDVYRDLPIFGCMYYNLFFRTRNVGAPGWSAWTDPTGVVYFGTEREWLRQVVALPAAAGKDSVQVRIGVKDYSQIYCNGVASPSNATVYFDNFAFGVVGLSGPVITASERDLFQDTFQTAPFFADDNLNTARGDTLSVRIAASRGLKSAALKYSLNGAAFATAPLAAVGPLVPNGYFGDVPAGTYPRGTALRYYVTATDSTDATSTLPADAVTASHYLSATVLPSIQTASASCAGDTARVLYVNAFSGPDGVSSIDQSLAALGVRYDRFDVNEPASSLGNTPGGANPTDPTQRWPATPVTSLGPYSAILWDAGIRSTVTLPKSDQALLQSWLGLAGKNRGLVVAGDNVALDLVANAADVGTFLTCTMGSLLTRDVWENTPQDTLNPNLKGAAGTRIALETFPISGGCPVLNHFDAFATSSCAGTQARPWMTYPNQLLAGVERRAPLAGTDTTRTVLLGFSIPTMTNTARRNLLLYRTLVDEFETPACYPASAVPEGTASPPTASVLTELGAAPNPFNPQTTIRFTLAIPARARIVIYDVSGAKVRVLADRPFAAGPQRLVWDGRDDRRRDLPSGAYIYRVEAAGAARSRKLILLR
jgi:flagellar hook capping protein FlgD